MFNGTNVAGQTTYVVAGQEIMLTGQAPDQECVSATVSQQWSLPLENGKRTKNAVGGYVVGPNASTEDPARRRWGQSRRCPPTLRLPATDLFIGNLTGNIHHDLSVQV